MVSGHGRPSLTMADHALPSSTTASTLAKVVEQVREIYSREGAPPPGSKAAGKQFTGLAGADSDSDQMDDED